MPIVSVPSAAGSLDNFDLVQITAEGVSDGQAVANVWYASNPLQTGSTFSGAAAIAEMTKLTDAMKTFYTRWLTLLGSTLTMTSYKAKKVLNHVYVGTKGKFAFDIQGFTAASEQGVKTGDELPVYAAVTLALRTGDTGRHYRGSKRFSPIVEVDTENNLLTDTALAEWISACSGALGGWDTAVTGASCGIPWKIVVAQVDKVDPATATPPPAGSTYYSPVTVFQVSQILGSQVSRKRKRVAA